MYGFKTQETDRSFNYDLVGIRQVLVIGFTALVLAVPTYSQEPVESPGGLFEFHVDPWISLHHFAYHFVREQESALRLRGRVPLTDDDRRSTTDEFRSACSALTAAYQPYIERTLLFDVKTRALAKALKSGPDAVTDDEVRGALKACMPAYRKVFWPQHRDAGERLREHLIRQLKLHETQAADRFASLLDGSWPQAPIRVDLTPYANWAGAYTDDSPSHITISSLDKAISEQFAFEILFHESGHTGSFAQSLLRESNAAIEVTGLENDRYWHYVLFYVAGIVTADVLGDATYVPMAKSAGLTEREDARAYYQALEETWGIGGTFSERVLRAAEWVRDKQ